MNMKLEVFSDLSEELHYNRPDFPLYAKKGALNQFDQYAAACHWHPDLEFILMLDGQMEYFINGEIVNIVQGEGVFVNSRRLHYGFSSHQKNGSFIVIAVHPSLFGESTYLGKTFFEEKFGSATQDYMKITPRTEWEREVLAIIERIYEETESAASNPMRLLALASQMCAAVSERIRPISGRMNEDQSWTLLHGMTSFVHRHFHSKITLDEIAASGSVCRSKCCDLFDKYTGTTPNAYLVRYRIRKSCEMLADTNRSVSEIALRCGFQSGSYFSYVFRNEMGMTPLRYRKSKRLLASSDSGD